MTTKSSDPLAFEVLGIIERHRSDRTFEAGWNDVRSQAEILAREMPALERYERLFGDQGVVAPFKAEIRGIEVVNLGEDLRRRLADALQRIDDAQVESEGPEESPDQRLVEDIEDLRRELAQANRAP